MRFFSFLVLTNLFVTGCGSNSDSSTVWDKASWGMTREDLVATYPDANNDEDTLSIEKTSIAGIDFKVEFDFDGDGTLDHITLETDEGNPEQYEKLYALLMGKYGETDGEPIFRTQWMNNALHTGERFTWYREDTRIVMQYLRGISSALNPNNSFVQSMGDDAYSTVGSITMSPFDIEIKWSLFTSSRNTQLRKK